MRGTLAALIKSCLTLALLAGGRPRLGRERGDADIRVSSVLRPDATESEVQDLLLRAITESARQTEFLDACTRDVCRR